MQIGRGRARYYSPLDAAKVNDPELKMAIEAVKVSIDSLLKTEAIFARAGCASAEADTWIDPRCRYPLFIADAAVRHPHDLYLYLNAKYAFDNQAST